MTAVTWLQQKIKEQGVSHYFSINELTQQALSLEREQIEYAYNQGYRDAEVDYGVDIPKDISLYQNAHDYYTEIFKR